MPNLDPNSQTDVGTLTPEAAREECERLSAELSEHNYRYYVLSRPTVSDGEYDRLFRRLQAIEVRFPELRAEDSPTQRVGSPPVSALPTIRHTAPMLSLDSTQDEADVRRFDERIRKAAEHEIEYLLEPKLDGASLELVYENGLLARAVTRGNGIVGEGVTENVRTIPSVPLRLRSAERPVPELLAVRGEALMYLSEFEALNERVVNMGGEPYVNPRNSASGALRQLDSRSTAERPLEFLAYDILLVRGASFETDWEGFQALGDWGFKRPERVELTRDVDGILAYHAAFGRDRDDLDYEIDGVVVKLNHLTTRVDLGSTSHHPRWALAFKFEPRKEVTRIERIAVSVGRTGKITPVALLRPVEVGGVTVSRASLHNREELLRKDVREGDLVRIQRAGDVIPQVVERVAEDARTRAAPFEMPNLCPACGTPVEEDGPFTVCPNRFGCPAQLKRSIEHFGSRGALDIEGLGEETATQLVERGLVRELANLFDLKIEDLVGLEGFAEKSASKLVDAIRTRRKVELRRFLHGLGVPEVGATVAGELARHFRSFERIREASREDLEDVSGIGPKMSEVIHEFFRDPRNSAAIDAILSKGFEFGLPPAPAGDSLAGKKFVFTGGLDGLSRSEAKKRVESLGGRVVSSVSRDTDYVVAGNDPGSKLTKAQELGVAVLDENSFRELIETPSSRTPVRAEPADDMTAAPEDGPTGASRSGHD